MTTRTRAILCACLAVIASCISLVATRTSNPNCPSQICSNATDTSSHLVADAQQINAITAGPEIDQRKKVRSNNFLLPWRVASAGDNFKSLSTPSSLVAQRVSAPYSLATSCWTVISSRENLVARHFHDINNVVINDKTSASSSCSQLGTKNDRVVLATTNRRPAASKIPSFFGAGSLVVDI